MSYKTQTSLITFPRNNIIVNVQKVIFLTSRSFSENVYVSKKHYTYIVSWFEVLFIESIYQTT
jgi:hypothetical protein